MKKKVIIKAEKSQPFINKHPWVFSGAIDNILGAINNGDVVYVVDSNGKHIGYGLYNSNSQIRVKLFHYENDDKSFDDVLNEKIVRAIDFRLELLRTIYKGITGIRLINSEGDGLPGLTIDLYDNVLSIQLTTYGLYNYIDKIINIVKNKLKDYNNTEIPFVKDSTLTDIKSLEGIKTSMSFSSKDLPEYVIINEYGKKYKVNIKSGQKTGFYLDQRDNRHLLSLIFNGLSILDCFCYTGSFSIALSDNNKVIGVESSGNAIFNAKGNLHLNGIENSVEFVKDDVYKYLNSLQDKSFDAIILDPPKMVFKETQIEQAISKYIGLNSLAINKIRQNGYLASFSCSGRVYENDFEMILKQASIVSGRNIRICYKGGASLDHPTTPYCLEHRYLKFILCWLD